jgi:putative flippase GtrA
MKAFVKFVGIGGLATAFQYGLMILFIEIFSINAILASAVSYAISALFNYTANYYLTFKSDAKHLQTLPKFMIATVLVLMLNTLLFSLFFKLGLHYLLAQVFATTATLFVNFIVHKFWIYRK